MTTTELLSPRYKMIAGYPHSNIKIGDILHASIEAEGYYDKYPHLFKKLGWWEERSIETLSAIKYVKIVTYRGYWLVGDIVPALFTAGSIEKVTQIGFYMGQSHYQPIYELLPSSEEDYLKFKKI